MISCVWNVFADAIIPIGVAIFGVYVAEHYARKRDWKQKQIEIQIDYLKREIEYLTEMENGVISVTRLVDKCLITRDTDKKVEIYNLVMGRLSELNIKSLSVYYELDCYNKAMNLEIDIEKYKNSIGTCISNFKKMCDSCLQEPNKELSEDEINNEISIVKNEIECAIEKITNKMVEYLKVE